MGSWTVAPSLELIWRVGVQLAAVGSLAVMVYVSVTVAPATRVAGRLANATVTVGGGKIRFEVIPVIAIALVFVRVIVPDWVTPGISVSGSDLWLSVIPTRSNAT